MLGHYRLTFPIIIFIVTLSFNYASIVINTRAQEDPCVADKRFTKDGGPGTDEINWNDLRNIEIKKVMGRGGNDMLIAGDSDVCLVGGPGRDTLVGGPGRNVLDGGLDPDTFFCVAGDNKIVGFVAGQDHKSNGNCHQ
jgi:Ca2+-binding RTX toxin-like protein